MLIVVIIGHGNIYVANIGSNSRSEIDRSTNVVVNTIKQTHDPIIPGILIGVL